ncbi:MAG TPA: PPK2 family polyphosphate kinase [Ktedonobacteraceae bacterium]|nr:PPK2 family polyphosphate kinase [Ktedonobacteraceae bacterium]
MAKDYAWKVEKDSTIKLKDYDPVHILDKITPEAAALELQNLGEEISMLQELLAEAQHHSMLIILQGTDTSGKDGTIRHVFNRVNPLGCYVHSFKAPTSEELAHDFLWRVHRNTPGKGALCIFNRSHYEDVLIARVQCLVPKSVWSERYEEINNFEKLLADNNTIILKFFLHISYEEQGQRLLAREQNLDKAWKIDASDWEARKYWHDYQQAYEDALNKCSTGDAPWYIVPANHKWYRNLAVSHILARTMRQYKDEWKAQLEERGKRELEKLNQLRKAQ